MNFQKVEFELAAWRKDQLPRGELPEIVFSGKSNVGKSSLINALMNRKSLARTSGQPGKTQTINFYNLNDQIYLVDLPGYGYAKTAKRERELWGEMIERYLHTSDVLRAVFLLVDIRHAPSENDRQMFDWMKYMGFDPVVIATKLDKIKRSQVNRQIKVIREGLGADGETIIVPFSAQTKQGRETIWDFMDQVIENESENA